MLVEEHPQPVHLLLAVLLLPLVATHLLPRRRRKRRRRSQTMTWCVR